MYAVGGAMIILTPTKHQPPFLLYWTAGLTYLPLKSHLLVELHILACKTVSKWAGQALQRVIMQLRGSSTVDLWP